MCIRDSSESSFDEKLFSAKYKFPVLLAFLLAFFNQLSGINAFLYYAPRIFETAGLKESSALLSSIGIGVTNLIFTLLGLYLIFTFKDHNFKRAIDACIAGSQKLDKPMTIEEAKIFCEKEIMKN